MTQSRRSSDLPRFADLDAEYEILKELGRGGTAVVYLARERELGRKVAIKVIRSTYVEDEEAAARLVREARTVGRLQHPNIVMLYGTRRLRDNSLALIMQYVPGHTLKKEIRTRGPLPFDMVERILIDIGRALAYAQRHRIVHRDIKPENVYLDEETGIARLSDFGIARPWDAESGLTLPGMAIGTPAYMAPEQIDGGVLDGRSDLYSLGLVGYEMLTGTPPWAGESLFSMIYKQRNEALPALAELRPGIPDHLRLAIEGTLAKQRDDRWADADAFLAALRAGQSDRAEERVTGAPAAPPTDTDTTGTYLDDVEGAVAGHPEYSPTIQYRRPEGGQWVVAGGSQATGHVEHDGADTAFDDDRAALARDAARAADDAGDADDEPAAVASLAERFVRHRPRRPRRRRAVVAGIALVALAGAAAAIVLAQRSAERRASAEITRAQDNAPPAASGPAPAAAARPPAVMYALYGADQIGTAADTLPQPLAVKVEDAAGQPVAGAAVRFAVVAGSGEVVPESTSTDASGVARAHWVLGTPGPQEARAQVAGLDDRPTIFSALATSRAAARLRAVSPAQLRGTAGRAAASPLVVRVEDDGGRPVAGAEVRFAVRSGGGTIEPATAVTDSAGEARARWTLGEGREQEVAAMVAALEDDEIVFTATSSPPPLPVRRGVTVGGTHTCSLTAEGVAYCWGGNDRGQLGDGSGSRRGTPVRVDAPEPFATLSAGVSHTCAVGVSGAVYCWGANDAGQAGGEGGRLTPARISADRLVAVSAGMSHSCGLDPSGRLLCWGRNDHGQLGDGTRSSRSAPVRAGGSRVYRSVAVGWAHTCALGTDGTAYCWGRNSSGELGDGSTGDRAAPAAVAGNHRFTAITAGSSHTCGLRADGAILCWGNNGNGQLGNGGGANSPVAVQVAAEQPFAAVTAGGVHTCGLARDNRALCWGRNVYGQLGDGTTEDRARPVEVVGNLGFTGLTVSGAHTCGATRGGTLYCWGFNLEGQLGDGTRQNQTRPVAVGSQ